ncbi:MAG TPA: hydrogenase maturation protease [Anaerolineales bacterium]
MSQSGDSARDKHPGTIKLIGIGQSLRGDDAAGLAAVRLWQEKYQLPESHPDLQVELAELPGVGLLSLLEGCRFAILVDAVRSDAKAGTIHILRREQLESFQAGAASAHGWGVAETLELGQQLMPTAMPDKLIVIGIEAGEFSLGEPLSQEVEAVLPEVAQLIEQLLRGQ